MTATRGRPVRVLALLGLLLAAGCGGGDKPEPAPSEIAQARELGRFVFERGRYEEAARLFARALRKAHARDDIDAITELGYERALAELRAGDARKAARHAADLRSELERRDRPVPARVDLVAASALYDLGESNASRRQARRVLDKRDAGPAAGRAHYLLGMIAADRGDTAGLADAQSALAKASHPALVADRRVLEGRLAMQRGRPDAALNAFEAAADARRRLRDEAGMAGALALAGEAADAAGTGTRAADLYYRAGRTAALIDRPDKASTWLRRAVRAAEAAGAEQLEAQAKARLDDLATGTKR